MDASLAELRLDVGRVRDSAECLQRLVAREAELADRLQRSRADAEAFRTWQRSAERALADAKGTHEALCRVDRYTMRTAANLGVATEAMRAAEAAHARDASDANRTRLEGLRATVLLLVAELTERSTHMKELEAELVQAGFDVAGGGPFARREQDVAGRERALAVAVAAVGSREAAVGSREAAVGAAEAAVGAAEAAVGSREAAVGAAEAALQVRTSKLDVLERVLRETHETMAREKADALRALSDERMAFDVLRTEVCAFPVLSRCCCCCVQMEPVAKCEPQMCRSKYCSLVASRSSGHRCSCMRTSATDRTGLARCVGQATDAAGRCDLCVP